MVPTDRGVIRVAEADDKLLIFDISDDALERAAPNAELRYCHCRQLRLPLHGGLKVSIGQPHHLVAAINKKPARDRVIAFNI